MKVPFITMKWLYVFLSLVLVLLILYGVYIAIRYWREPFEEM